MSLLLEVFAVAFICGIIGSIVSLLVMYTDKTFSFTKYPKFQVFISFFITGAIVHLLFEYIGGNRWYCEKGYACLQKNK